MAAGPGLHDLGEGVFLEIHDALDRFHQVGDEVVAAFQLDVDLAPGIVHFHAVTDQLVVDRNQVKNDQECDSEDEQNHNNPNGGHGNPFLS